MPLISYVRSLFELVTRPTGLCCADHASAVLGDHYLASEGLPETNELGNREDLLRAMAICARLCYGSGSVEDEHWGLYDPPLNGEGWKAVNQILETQGSAETIQAALYVKAGTQLPIGIVAYRGTVSKRGLMQDLAVTTPINRQHMKEAIKEACCFFQLCQKKYPNLHLYVTGHSLGGYIAEACASYEDAPGAVFNSPGPWHVNPVMNSAGEKRPDFEVHLTRDDPLAFAVFPKPESSKHIGEVTWHPGQNHRICEPYMKEITEMEGIQPNDIPVSCKERSLCTMNQVSVLFEDYVPPPEIDQVFDAQVETIDEVSDAETSADEGVC